MTSCALVPTFHYPELTMLTSCATPSRYKCIVKYKTAFYSFYLPVAMGMHMAGITEKEKFDNALEILLEMGEFFQIQDDYLDCYGE